MLAFALLAGATNMPIRADDGAAADSVPISYDLKGVYIDSCACAVSCGCDYGADAGTAKGCQAVIGLHFTSGSYGGVDLAGLTAVGMILKPVANIGANIGKLEGGIYLDAAATAEQREALLAITMEKLGGFFGSLKEPKAVSITVNSSKSEGADVNDIYSLAIPDILNLTIKGYKNAEGKVSGRINVPNCLVPIQYQGQASVHTYADKDWAVEWDFAGKNGFFGNFEFKN